LDSVAVDDSAVMLNEVFHRLHDHNRVKREGARQVDEGTSQSWKSDDDLTTAKKKTMEVG